MALPKFRNTWTEKETKKYSITLHWFDENNQHFKEFKYELKISLHIKKKHATDELDHIVSVVVFSWCGS